MQRSRKLAYLAATALASSLVAIPLTLSAPIASAATPRTVNVVGNLFAPQDLGTIEVGDTITFNNNSEHTVTSATIPAGAATFDSGVLAGNVTFAVTPTVPGNYRYYCDLHSNAGAADTTPQAANRMVGQFTVVAAAPPPTTAPPSTPAPPPTTAPPSTPAPPPTTAPPSTPAPPPTTAPPTTMAHIDKLSPRRGSVGDTVTITGTGFGTAGVVMFGKVMATATVSTDTQIVVTVPDGVKAKRHGHRVKVTVTAAGGTASNAKNFRLKKAHKDHDGDNDDD